MSSSRWAWLLLAVLTAIAAFALGEVVLGWADPAARVGTGIRGQVVKASLSGRRPLDYFLFVPTGAPRDAPLLVSIHGISRKARLQAERFAPFAARYGFNVVAPQFDEDEFDDYQRLGRRGRGPRADEALDYLLDELARQGVACGDLFLFGYSGGAQFVHRYVMAHPERVRAGIVASAGWYTFPDPSVDYPYGTRVDAKLRGVRLRPDEFLRVPMLAVVGNDDRKRDESLRRSHALDHQQGRNRVERAERWVRAMQRAAKKRDMTPRVELALLEGSGHSFEEGMNVGLGEVVADYLTRWRRPETASAAFRAREVAAPWSRWCVAGGC